MGEVFLRRCKLGPIVYVVFRVLTTAAALLCEVTGHYREGVIDYRSAWIYLATINCITQTAALYCLVMFYLAFRKDLAPVRPVAKMLVRARSSCATCACPRSPQAPPFRPREL